MYVFDLTPGGEPEIGLIVETENDSHEFAVELTARKNWLLSFHKNDEKMCEAEIIVDKDETKNDYIITIN